MASAQESVNRGKWLLGIPVAEYQRRLLLQIERNSTANENGCREWHSSKFKNGYGQTRLYGQVTSAHRAAYFAYHGVLDRELDVCHSCDNRACVEKSHLFQATHMENMQDMMSKGRRVQGASNPNRGAKNHQSKAVYVSSFIFGSVGEAGRVLGLTKRAIQFRIKAGKASFIEEK